MNLFIVMFLISMFMFSFCYSHIFMSLISLEFMMLSLLTLMFKVFEGIMEINMLLFFLVFVVCESVLGLTLLILLIRSNGNDSMNMLNLLIL
uniref:NADH-ubiquinone oxidoreductase chain 4L n=1 Tax=Eupelmus anpingensis TaxID=2989843 RepID=A0A9E7V2W9_9HYME|nr:NADH dehydrogenase subunit 4L [Eupelmus anpingensis]UYR45768.1 NADH dehydrogenase subunit 4L [Eupelmus anpingensis]